MKQLFRIAANGTMPVAGHELPAGCAFALAGHHIPSARGQAA